MLAFTALLALVPALVAAQSSVVSNAAATASAAAAGLPNCALTCTIQEAGSSSCGGITNPTCLCTDTAFQSAVYQCYQSSCSAADLQAAVTYGSQLCSSLGVTLDTTAVPSGVAYATGSSAAASTTSAAAASSSSAATSTSAASSSAAATSSSAAQATSSAAAASSQGTGTGYKNAVGASAIAAVAGLVGFVAFL